MLVCTIGDWNNSQSVQGINYKENPKDPNAVCVLDGPHKKAYLKRENAFIVSKLMTGIIKLLVT